MRRKPIVRWRCLSLLPFCLAVSAQVTPANQTAPQGPVSYSSVNQLNSLLSQLEQEFLEGPDQRHRSGWFEVEKLAAQIDWERARATLRPPPEWFEGDEPKPF